MGYLENVDPTAIAVKEVGLKWSAARRERERALARIIARIDRDPATVRGRLERILRMVGPGDGGDGVVGPDRCGASGGPLGRRRSDRERRRAGAAVMGGALASVQAAIARELDADHGSESERLRAALAAMCAAMREWPMLLVGAIRDESDRPSAAAGALTIDLAGMLSTEIKWTWQRLADSLRDEEPGDGYGLYIRRLPGAVWEAVTANRALASVKEIRNKVATIIAGKDRSVEHKRKVRFPDADGFAIIPDRSNAADPEARVLASDDLERRIRAAGVPERNIRILYRSAVAGYSSDELAALFRDTPANIRAITSRTRKRLRSAYPGDDAA